MRYILLALVLISLALVGCEAELPTATPTATIVIIPASATPNPVVPTEKVSEGGLADPLGYTPGAPPTSASVLNITVTPIPLPTVTSLPVEFPIGDGLTVIGNFYASPVKPAPAIVLLHGLGGDRAYWSEIAAQFQTAGYNVLAIDLRGYGDTAGQVDWTKAPRDVIAVLNSLRTFPGVDASRMSILGVDIGANVALNTCAATLNCATVMLLSPTLNTQGLETVEAIAQYGNRPVLIMVSRNDPTYEDSAALNRLALGDHQIVVFEGSANGLLLFSAQPTLTDTITTWLKTH